MPSAAGHQVRVAYLHEDNGFKSSPNDSTYKTFGADATLTTLEGSNNAVRLFDPSSREAADIIEQQFEGSWTAEFTLTNPWWLQTLIDESPSTSGASAPYTHTYSGDVPDSSRIYTYDEANDIERELLGCVAVSATISADVGGNVTVTLEGAYADESSNSSPGSPVSQPTTSYRPMTFAEATVERPSGTTLSLVQNASLSIQNNTDLIRELGSRFAVDYSPKVRAASIDYTDIKEDDNEKQRMYGSSTAQSPQADVDNTTTLDFVFDNGDTGSSKNSLTISLSTVFPDQYGLSGAGDPEADLEGTLSEMAASVSATAENDQSSAL